MMKGLSQFIELEREKELEKEGVNKTEVNKTYDKKKEELQDKLFQEYETELRNSEDPDAFDVIQYLEEREGYTLKHLYMSIAQTYGIQEVMHKGSYKKLSAKELMDIINCKNK